MKQTLIDDPGAPEATHAATLILRKLENVEKEVRTFLYGTWRTYRKKLVLVVSDVENIE